MPRPQPNIPGLVIGGTGSNAGKTTFTLALLCALHDRGLRARAAKTGPDYIDAAFHALLTGQPAANLDTWMCRESAPSPAERPLQTGRVLPAGLQRVFERMRTPTLHAGAGDAQAASALAAPPDLLVVEGAMGLFDGGHKGAGSTAHLAALLGLPVLLVLNAGGMGQSVAALAEGFLHHRPAWAAAAPPRFLGMVCTHVGSARHADLLRTSLTPLAKEAGVPLLGLLPREGAPHLPSRHLGLVEAREALPTVDRQALSQWLEQHCDLDRLLKLAGTVIFRRPASTEHASATGCQPATGIIQSAGHEPYPAAQQPPPDRFFPLAEASPPQSNNGPTRRKPAARELVVGLAWDQAFSFCYADLPAMLHELRARVVTFSPMRDSAPPAACSGLYFPGGYPELHAPALATNASMHAALQSLAGRGMPIYGECGGYMYLMRAIQPAGQPTRQQDGQQGGQAYAMSGLLPRSCSLGQTRAALGYRAGLAAASWLETGSPTRPLWVRGHEFHYAQEEASPLPPACQPLWKLYDSQGTFLRDEGCRLGSVAGSWLHCYPEGSRRFWRAWLRTCAAYRSDNRS